MEVNDADDLAKFAAASRADAEKRAAARKVENIEKPAATMAAKKPQLDEASQAFLTRLSKEQNLSESQVAEYGELMASLSPEVRQMWLAQWEAVANRGKEEAATAKVTPEKKSEVAAVSYEEPAEEMKEPEATPHALRKSPLGRAAHLEGVPEKSSDAKAADSALVEELRALKAELSEFRARQKEQEAAEQLRAEAKAEEERRKLMMQAVSGQGAIKGMVADDDLSGGLGALGSNLMGAEVAAAMAKAEANRKEVSKAGETVDAVKPATGAGASPKKETLSGAELEKLWTQIAAEEGEGSAAGGLSRAMRKRIFLLAAGDANLASAPPEELTAPEKEYWKHLMRVLELTVKLGDHPRRDRQAALVGRELRDAASELETASVLDLQNATFCSSVQAFGNYVEFEEAKFKPDDEVILYVELQNFASRQRADGKAYETELKASYQVLDAMGKRVADVDLPNEHGACRQRRRDYFLAYRMHLPKKIAAGSYTLQLTMEDKISGKFGQTTVGFVVGE